MTGSRVLRAARACALALLPALLVAGCTAPATLRVNDDGTAFIDCSGGYHNWSGCHSRARRYCGAAGFDILSRLSDEGSSAVGVRDWSGAGRPVTRSLVIRCRE